MFIKIMFKKIAFIQIMHLWFPLLCSFILFFSLLGSVQGAKKLEIVADYWPPFTTDQKGQRMAADLVETALSNAGITHETQLLPWQDVMSGVKSGKYDAIIGAWKNKERESYLMYSRAYLENRIKLVGRIDNKIEFKTLEQLTGKKVGIVDGYAYGPEISDNKSIIKIKGASLADNIKSLNAKKIDYLLADSIVAQAMKEFLPKDIRKNLIIYEKAVLIKPLYFALRKNYPQGKVILEKFNQAISNMIGDGSYNKILGFSWVLADTNSDGIYEYIASDNVKPGSNDPASQQFGYQVFSEEDSDHESNNNLKKSPPIKYRILNQNYDTWRDAEKAMQKAHKEGVSPQEDTSDTFNFLIGKW